MPVYCTECGYENRPEFRFCGMCGAPLKIPKAPAGPAIALHGTDLAPASPAEDPAPVNAVLPTPRTDFPSPSADRISDRKIDRTFAERDDLVEPLQTSTKPNVPDTPTFASSLRRPPVRIVEPRSDSSDQDHNLISGPSLLGLSQEPPSSGATYLLEDDDSSSHRGHYLILLLIPIAVAVAAWHYRQDLPSLAGRLHKNAVPESSAAEENPAAPVSTSPSEVAPAAANGPTTTDKPKTGVGDQPSQNAHAAPAQPQNQPLQSSQTAPMGSPDNTASDGTPEAHSATTSSEDEEAANPAPERDSATSPGAARTAALKPESANPAPAKPARSTASSKPSPAKSYTSANSAVREASSRTETSGTPDSRSDSQDYLVTEGEKYLYGNGAAQNCRLAQKDLLAAAEHLNTHAQSILGTMYATGHCVTRDLPVSYRWFAKALHSDPNNTRIEQDLEILWKQMTPDERRIAQSSD